MKWEANGKILESDSGKTVVFQFDIKRFAAVGSLVVVVLAVPQGKVMTENVFGVSESGKVIWQIERIPETSSNPINSYDLTAIGEDTIRLASWNDVVVDVDAKSGKIINKYTAVPLKSLVNIDGYRCPVKRKRVKVEPVPVKWVFSRRV